MKCMFWALWRTLALCLLHLKMFFCNCSSITGFKSLQSLGSICSTYPTTCKALHHIGFLSVPRIVLEQSGWHRSYMFQIFVSTRQQAGASGSCRVVLNLAGRESDFCGSDPVIFALMTHTGQAPFNDLTAKHQTLVFSTAGGVVYTGMKQTNSLVITCQCHSPLHLLTGSTRTKARLTSWSP